MNLDGIEPDGEALNIVVLGPGFGESILVKSPKSPWVVIDSFFSAVTDDVPPLRFLKRGLYPPEFLFLSHRHEDHIGGAEALIDHYPDLKVVINDQLLPAQPRGATNFRQLQRAGRKNAALARIRDLKVRDSGRVLDLHQGENLACHDLEISALYPPRGHIAGKGKAGHPNDHSSPLRIRWKQCEIMLGSDLERKGWQAVHRWQKPARAVLFKVPHHSSKNAQSKEELECGHGILVTTPYTLGAECLPRLEDHEGLAFILGFGNAVHLTAIPYKLKGTHGRLLKRSRRQIRDKLIFSDRGVGRKGLKLKAPKEMTHGWIHYSFLEDGRIKSSIGSEGSYEIQAESGSRTSQGGSRPHQGRKSTKWR